MLGGKTTLELFGIVLFIGNIVTFTLYHTNKIIKLLRDSKPYIVAKINRRLCVWETW